MTDNFQVNWRSRIVKSGKILASQLTPHPNNPKYHPPSQREAIATSIDTYGQVAPVVVNLNNGYLVDGHERGWLAIAQSQDVEVDAIWVDITEQEHLQLLALYDHIGHMAGYEPELLDTLLQQVNSDDEVIQRLLSQLGTTAGLYSPDNPYDEWVGMPEFEQESILGYKTIKVVFETEQDFQAFAKLVNQTMTDKTTLIYYPKKEPREIGKYIDGNQS